jgi:hypothetical protein
MSRHAGGDRFVSGSVFLMAIGFAGSRQLDERRRRRLASNPVHDAPTETTSTESVPSDDGSVDEQNRSHFSHVSHFPLRKLISPKAWKLWGIGLLGLLAGVALLRAGQFAAEAGSGTSDGFVRLFDPVNGRAMRVYGSVLLMISGQLAILIGWVRSRSPLDFGGRYRVWTKIAAAGVAASLFLITDFHLLIMDVIQWRTNMDQSYQLQLCWLIPAVICAAFLFRMMHQEMRENRLSLVLLWVAAASGLITTLQNAGVSLPGFEGETQLLKSGIVLFAQLSLMMSLLFHTRHVIYVSLDPPEKKSVPKRSRSQIRLPRLRLTNLFRRTEREKSKEADQNDVEEPSVNKPPFIKKPRKKCTSNEAPTDSPTSTNQSLVTQEEKRASQIEEFNQNLRVDEPIDTDLLKGLSKKQRRKLRKQHRQMQRSASSESPDSDDED